ncbi:hypothetical protein [Planctobacterium marinum]|uniref:Uncharacterized protein n=1 Tax=Planctobacterium marinum TaxID=1631968 RepID=A0AA48KPT8_9ALTE|nr:hypothetical protein MACH26_25270 [Planctobacterium marinum]
MNQNQTEKIVLEKQAAELFATCYQREFDVPVSFVSNNVPAKPDVTCRVGNDLVDIEIAHLYGSQAEAQQILGKSLDEKTQAELNLLEAETNTDDRLVRALNRILANKANKHYDGDNVWLVIRNANPQWQRHNIQNNLARISIPDGHPFKQVWLIGDYDGASGLVFLNSL